MSIQEVTNDHLSEGFTFQYHDKAFMWAGKISRKWMDEMDIKQPVYFAEINWDTVMQIVKTDTVEFQELSKFPEARRDLALLVDDHITFSQLRDAAFKLERNLLKKINLFDIYSGDKIDAEKKSYAISFILQDERKTLTDKVIDKVMNRLMNMYKSDFGAIIR